MKIIVTHTCQKAINKQLSQAQKNALEQAYTQIFKGIRVGKTLGPPELRQIRLREKRAYYILQTEQAIFVAISGKKEQQAVINRIRKQLSDLNDSS